MVGETRRMKGPLVLRHRGYQWWPTPATALQYAPGPVLCLVEVEEEGPRDETRSRSRSRKLLKAVNVDRDLRLQAWRMALDVLPVYESIFPDDLRLRYAIEVVRRYADGLSTVDELRTARNMAGALSHPVANTAYNATDANSYNAARTTAYTAIAAVAHAAAFAAADAAEGPDVRKHFVPYNAARSATRGTAYTSTYAATFAAVSEKYTAWMNEALLKALEE